MGEFPVENWTPTGVSVGDRLLYDVDKEQTVVFGSNTSNRRTKESANFIVEGDIISSNAPVRVFVPHPDRLPSRWRTVLREAFNGHRTLATLAAIGDPLHKIAHLEMEASRIRLGFLEPFLFYRLPAKGASLVHGAAVSSDGSGLLFVGSGHVGKTTFALEMVRRGWSYLGDDLTILDEQGSILSYPEPVKIEGHHITRKEIQNLIYGIDDNMLRRYLELKASKTDLESILPLMPRFQIQRLFPKATISDRAELKKLVLIIRKWGAEPRSYEIDIEKLVNIIASELYWEFEGAVWRHTQYIYAPSCANGKDHVAEDMERHRKIVQIIERAVSHASAIQFVIPPMLPIEQFGRLIDNIDTL